MLDLARSVRGFMNRFSTMEVLGVPIDWFFHMVGAAVFVLAASRFLAMKTVVRLTLALLVGKELFDVFAKTRIEYIRAPGLDLLFDMTAGLAGLGLGWWIARRIDRGKAR